MTGPASAPEGSVAAPDWLAAHRVMASSTTMDDVVGLEAAKREIRSLASRVLYPEVIIAAGAEIARGILLYGPVGCGKTMLVRALVSLLISSGVEVEFFSLAASDLNPERFEELSRWLGQRDGSSLVCVYIDEIDLWGRDREDFRASDSSRATLLAALAAIDGLDDRSRNRVLWLASASQSRRLLDAALVRPGRFGFHVQIRYPTFKEREAILRHYAASRRCDPGIDWSRAAALASGRTSPAELRQSLDDALALALSERGASASISWRELEEAILRRGRIEDRRPPSVSEDWASAIHEASHAVVSRCLGIKVLSMSLRHDGGRTEAGEDDEPNALMTTIDESSNEITAALAGTVGEEILIGRPGMGSASDVAVATSLARRRVAAAAEPAARPIDHDQFERSPAAEDDRFLACAAIVSAGRTRAQSLVAGHPGAIKSLAQALVEARHLSGTDLEEAFVAAGV